MDGESVLSEIFLWQTPFPSGRDNSLAERCRWSDSNRHEVLPSRDFKSRASANFATPAFLLRPSSSEAQRNSTKLPSLAQKYKQAIFSRQVNLVLWEGLRRVWH